MYSAVLNLHRQHIDVKIHIDLGVITVGTVLGVAEVALKYEARRAERENKK